MVGFFLIEGPSGDSYENFSFVQQHGNHISTIGQKLGRGVVLLDRSGVMWPKGINYHSVCGMARVQEWLILVIKDDAGYCEYFLQFKTPRLATQHRSLIAHRRHLVIQMREQLSRVVARRLPRWKKGIPKQTDDDTAFYLACLKSAFVRAELKQVQTALAKDPIDGGLVVWNNPLETVAR